MAPITAACNDELHGQCSDSVWDGVDLLFCQCWCHAVVTPECQAHDHDACREPIPMMITVDGKTETYTWSHRRTCDCPCHFIETREQLLELRERMRR